MGSDLPLGVVTFLMTDVESSTTIWRHSPAAASSMERQFALIAEAVRRFGGVQPADQGEGDSTLAAFARPLDALRAALEAQRALVAESWPTDAGVRVRMAVHSGDAELRGERNYGGLTLIHCARLRALARGGQVLVSDATRALTRNGLPEAASLVALDTIRLDSVEHAETVHQLCHPDLPGGLVELRHAPTARLPVWPTALVGRSRELGEVAELLGQSRLITLTGVGGSGKTRLALAVAEQTRERFAQGAVWIELARLSAGEQVAGAVIAARGLREVAGVPPLDLLTRHLADRELLLVLDNCEHLVEACAELADAIIRSAPRVRLLATSREPLGAAGETAWRVPSLALPAGDADDLARIAACDSVALFVARARAARGEFRLDDANAPLVARICRRLDGIPLALELAAARVGALSLERLADGLDDRFRLLTGGARNAIARQRTLLASVEWSHELLDEEERTLFRRLAVFAAPFTLDAVEAVAADDEIDALSVFDVLARLVDKSLVQHADDRYRLLETLRQYALERANDAGEIADLRDRHVDWFQRRAEGWRFDREMATTTQLAEVAREVPDLLAAGEWGAARSGRASLEIAHAVDEHFTAYDAFREGGVTATRLVAPLVHGSRAWLEGTAPFASLLLMAGDSAWMAAASAGLIEHAETLDPVARGFIETALAIPSAYLGQRSGQELLRRSAETGARLGNRKLEIYAQIHLAVLLAQIGDVGAARPLIAWLDRHVAEDVGVRFLIESSKSSMALYAGDFAAARASIERHVAAGFLFGASASAGVVGLWARDAALLRRGIEIASHLHLAGTFAGLPDLLEGWLRLIELRPDEAPQYLARAEQRGLFPNYVLWTRASRAELAFAKGDLDGAGKTLVELKSVLDGSELHCIRAIADLLACYVARARGSRLDAESIAQTTLASARLHEMDLVVTDALETLSVLAGDRGELDQAGRLLGAVSAFRERTGYRWQPQHHAREVEALRGKVSSAALAEGAALTLEQAADHASRGRGERGRPDHGWASLTPSENRVVELVAEGLPNAAIAKKLFVSLATVKTHLVHVYGKLDLATRAELAAAVTERRLKGASDARNG